MNTDNLVSYWQGQLLNLSNRYPTSGSYGHQSDLDSCASHFKTLVQNGVSLTQILFLSTSSLTRPLVSNCRGESDYEGPRTGGRYDDPSGQPPQRHAQFRSSGQPEEHVPEATLR